MICFCGGEDQGSLDPSDQGNQRSTTRQGQPSADEIQRSFRHQYNHDGYAQASRGARARETRTYNRTQEDQV